MASDTQACPACGQEIKIGAQICRHCKAPLGGPAVVPGAPAAPPKKSPAVMIILIVLCVCGGGTVVLGILAALLLPAIARATERAKVVGCANNLSLLWKQQNVYMYQFGGPQRLMPAQTGREFWLELTRTTPPLVDPDGNADLLQCPLRASHDRCDYLGPAGNVNGLGDADFVGADQDDNHPRGGGNALRKSGDVIEYEGSDWITIQRQLAPEGQR